MKNIWWKLTRYNIDIVPVEVVKETPAKLRYIVNCRYGGGERGETSAKVSEYYHFYPSFREAQAALIDRLKSKRAYAAAEAEEATANIAKVLEMTDPSQVEQQVSR
jgi:hypothetical protein